MKYLNILVVLAFLGFYSCTSDESGKGSASFYLTDAPIDAENITAVTITFSNVEVSGPEGWVTIKEYEESQSINLLELQGGETFFIDEAELTSGSYGQVRLGLLPNTTEENPDANFITFDDGSREALMTPSGNQSGYKVTGGFTIPSGGVTAVTIDFDVRKSVVSTGSGKYILKPTLRLVENNEVAKIEGNIVGGSDSNLAVFVYENGVYNENELIPDEDGLLFRNAITSAKVDDTNSFTLTFLNAGSYELYLAAYDENGSFIEILKSQLDVELQAGNNLELLLTIE